jgi:putative ABC transport system permease protein
VSSVARRKVLRDLWLARGRTAVLVLATAFSLTAVGAVLGAYGILAREMPRSFQSSRPAAATLVMEQGIDRALLEAVRQRPGIAGAERRAMLRLRVDLGAGERRPLTLFVIDDFGAMDIEAVQPVEGAWPPPEGTLLLDRMSLALLRTRLGASLSVTTPEGRAHSMAISGVVVDPGVAPAFQDQTGYAYVTPATVSALGLPADLDLLKLTVREGALDAARIERTARELSAWLAERGAAAREIRIPPPGEHPHQRLMNALAIVLLLFSLLGLALSGLLVATLVSGLLARQVRQIGAMKAIGALPSHIGRMYAGMVLAIGAAAVALALGPTVAGARAMAGVYADFSNVVLASVAIPWWGYGVLVLAGLLTPLLAAAAPVAAASRITVREAISDASLYRGPAGVRNEATGRAARALGPTLTLALRHALRRRRRLALSVMLLGLGGGAFMTGWNVEAAGEQRLAVRAASPGYDLELTLSRPHPTAELLQRLASLPQVAHVEPIGIATIAKVQAGEVAVAGTHKDGGHGALRLYALPPDTLFKPELLAGRWLEPDDRDALVGSPQELERFGVALGDTLSLSLGGSSTQWRVVGVVRGIGLGGSQGLYVSHAGFAEAIGQVGSTQGVRIVAARRDAAGQQDALRAVESALEDLELSVVSALDSELWTTILRNHVAIVQGALDFMGLLLGLVGALALASALGLGVVERTREFGVMQTLGATPSRVIWVVVAEALFVGLSSWLAAVALAAPLSLVIGDAVGVLVFGAPLPLVVSLPALLVWLAVALLGSAAAGALPARATSRLTVRDALAFT